LLLLARVDHAHFAEFFKKPAVDFFQVLILQFWDFLIDHFHDQSFELSVQLNVVRKIKTGRLKLSLLLFGWSLSSDLLS
jgi:hypothetical protein